MATTIPTLSPAELRGRLQELLDLARGVTAAERDMREKATELRRCDFDTYRYSGAIHGELLGVYELLVENHPADGLTVDDLIERIEDTIGVVDMAIAMEQDDA